MDDKRLSEMAREFLEVAAKNFGCSPLPPSYTVMRLLRQVRDEAMGTPCRCESWIEACRAAEEKCAEAEREQEQTRRTSQFHKDNHLAAEDEIDRMKTREKALREALDCYGRHLPSCWSAIDKGCDICDCGLKAALAGSG
jgi:hypothetical protein